MALDLIGKNETTRRIFQMVLGSTASISRIVCGIGIMNIPLATGTDRTRKIGLRRTPGAKRRDIPIHLLAAAMDPVNASRAE